MSSTMWQRCSKVGLAIPAPIRALRISAAICRGSIDAEGSGRLFVENCTFLNNYARTGNGGGAYITSSGRVRNCLFWGNSASGEDQVNQYANIRYSCIEGWTYGGTGNTTNDPYLVENSWHVSSTNSSCYQNGFAAYPHASDIDGELRFSDADPAIDIGADEFSE